MEVNKLKKIIALCAGIAGILCAIVGIFTLSWLLCVPLLINSIMLMKNPADEKGIPVYEKRKFIDVIILSSLQLVQASSFTLVVCAYALEMNALIPELALLMPAGLMSMGMMMAVAVVFVCYLLMLVLTIALVIVALILKPVKVAKTVAADAADAAVPAEESAPAETNAAEAPAEPNAAEAPAETNAAETVAEPNAAEAPAETNAPAAEAPAEPATPEVDAAIAAKIAKLQDWKKRGVITEAQYDEAMNKLLSA